MAKAAESIKPAPTVKVPRSKVEAVSLASVVKLPYRPKSFTLKQLRNAIAMTRR